MNLELQQGLRELKFMISLIKFHLPGQHLQKAHAGGSNMSVLGPEEVKKIKVKDKENEWEILAKNILVARISVRRDFVKAKESDRLRTKMANLSDLVWEREGLIKLLGDDSITVGMLSTWGERKDFYHSYKNTYSITSEETRSQLNKYIQSKLK